MPAETDPPCIYLFGGSNGAGKTTFARSYLRAGFPTPPRFLNADEIARGLSPLAPESVGLKAGKLLLSEIDGCLKKGEAFGLESTLSGKAQLGILKRAKVLGYRVEIFYLWIPSPAVAADRVAQRVVKGGHHIPLADIERRYQRSLRNFVYGYAPLADYWEVWDNDGDSSTLTLTSHETTLHSLEEALLP